MKVIAFFLILGGFFIFIFSFVLRAKKNDFDKDLKNALRGFEADKENIDDSYDADDNAIDNSINGADYITEFEENDEDFEILMKQTKAFIRIAGIAVIVVGIAVYFIY